MFSTVPKNKSINYTVITSADNKLAAIKGMTVDHLENKQYHGNVRKVNKWDYVSWIGVSHPPPVLSGDAFDGRLLSTKIEKYISWGNFSCF